MDTPPPQVATGVPPAPLGRPLNKLHRILKRINRLLRDIQRNGNTGIGKPEPLRYNPAGHWSRRITEEHRLVHRRAAARALPAALRIRRAAC